MCLIFFLRRESTSMPITQKVSLVQPLKPLESRPTKFLTHVFLNTGYEVIFQVDYKRKQLKFLE